MSVIQPCQKTHSWNSADVDCVEVSATSNKKKYGSWVVQGVMAKVLEESGNVRTWCVRTWTQSGYGKFRVIAALILCILAFKGLFLGWSSSSDDAALARETAAMKKAATGADTDRDHNRHEEQETGISPPGMSLGSVDDAYSSFGWWRLSQPLISHTWTCRKCGQPIWPQLATNVQTRCGAWASGPGQ